MLNTGDVGSIPEKSKCSFFLWGTGVRAKVDPDTMNCVFHEDQIIKILATPSTDKYRARVDRLTPCKKPRSSSSS